MKLSVADVDFSQLTENERWTLEAVIPHIEDGKDVKAIADLLGLDAKELQGDVDRLAAKVMALSGANELPPHSEEEFEALKQSLADHGQRYPILRGSASSGRPGEVIDGHARRRALAQLKIEPVYKDIDGSADQLRALGLVLNLARRHMSTSSRRGIVRAELLAGAERSDRAIAAAVGVSPTTVGTVRRELEQTGALSRLDSRVGRDGVAKPASRPRGQAAPPEKRSIRVLVAEEMFEQWVGGWVSCRAFRLAERRPGVHELEVQILDPVAATDQQRAVIVGQIGLIAGRMDRDVDDVAEELRQVAAEVFAREIPTLDDLSTDEAEWMISRAAGILGHEAST